MTEPAEPGPGIESIRMVTGLFQKAGQKIGRDLYRVILYNDGRGEVEYKCLNPTECLVWKWEDEAGLIEVLAGLSAGQTADSAVIRKKCTKCLMHERPAAPG